MQLNAKPREAVVTKGGLKQMRRAGVIPAVLYSKGKQGQSITVDRVEIETAFRKIKQGMLSTQRFELHLDKGVKKKVIIKDVQYAPANYRILHIDFEELSDTVPVQLNVPIYLVGTADCVGVKLGGFLRQVVRAVKVKCMPKDIPSQFEVDVKDLAVGKSIRLANLELSKGVKAISPANEVIVVVSKR